MNILVTGASGLLGSDIVQHATLAGHQVIKHCNQERPGYLSANLATATGLEAICNANWDTIIHCAAIKDPDQCEKAPEKAYEINVKATARLAKFAAENNRKMVFISTDYVFDGTNAPYAEDASPCPLNAYGKQKAEAEQAVLSASTNHIILRIPIIYGIAAGLEKSLLITAALKAINSTTECWMDTRVVRYPTYTGDIARAILLLLEKKTQGIFHISAQDKTSKYGICQIIAEILGKSTSHIEAKESDPTKEANRPEDAHLAIKRLENLGFAIEKPLKERMHELLTNASTL